MKTIKILFVAAILLLSQIAKAQSKSYKMYDAFSNQDGVTNFTFTKNMTNAFNIDFGDGGEEKTVSGDLHEIRFMSYNPEKGNLTGSEFTENAIAMLPARYKRYEDDEDDSDAEIWLLGRKKKFSECHIFINNKDEDQNRFIVSFYGDFRVDDLKGLSAIGQDFSAN